MRNALLFLIACDIAVVIADLNKALLKCHNELRQKHHAVELAHCKILTGEAQEWADHLAKEDKLDHSDNIFGENVYRMTLTEARESTEYLALATCHEWYKEIDGYNFDNPRHSVDTANFTQMIWKSSVHLGAGMSVSNTGNIYIVAMYFPPGNSAQQFVYSMRN